MNDFLEFSLCDADNKFFSNTIFEQEEILDLLVEHYIRMPRWKRRCNNGTIYHNTKKRKHYDDDDSVWFRYKEKFTGRLLSVTYDGKVKVDQRGKPVLTEDIMHEEIINRIRETISLSEEAEKLINDYLTVSEYEGFERIYHPVRRESFKQRDSVVKIIILFCLICGGLSARQLIHITNVMQEFEMSSELSYTAFRKAEALRKKEKCLLILVNDLRDPVKDYTLKDVIYLLELGEIPLEQEKAAYRMIQTCFQTNIEELEKYRYIIKKEYINV